jgi:uncharacterized membrane protein YgaE (UPF0421/DUF939 family)
MDKLILTINRVFSFLIGFLLATLVMTMLFIISTQATCHTNSSLKMRYVPARSIIITP